MKPSPSCPVVTSGKIFHQKVSTKPDRRLFWSGQEHVVRCLKSSVVCIGPGLLNKNTLMAVELSVVEPWVPRCAPWRVPAVVGGCSANAFL